jgi:hydrogenase maturation protease
MTGRTMIACLGNIFLGDDGFGVEVAQRLTGHVLPEGVRVTDYGIRGMHLAYDLAEGYDTTILVDAMQRGDEPGTVYVVEPDPARRPAGNAALSLFNAHGMQPDVVLDMAGTLGIEAGRVLVVGLSPPVSAAVDEAVRVIIRLVTPGQERRPAGPQEEITARG